MGIGLLLGSSLNINNIDGESKRKRKEQSFFVPAEEIRNNDYDLSINKYKKIEYEEVKYDAPGAILKRIKGLEEEIVQGF